MAKGLGEGVAKRMIRKGIAKWKLGGKGVEQLTAK
jgi:hypothetical protein